MWADVHIQTTALPHVFTRGLNEMSCANYLARCDFNMMAMLFVVLGGHPHSGEGLGQVSTFWPKIKAAMEHLDPSTPACQCQCPGDHYMALGLAVCSLRIQMPLGCVLSEEVDSWMRLRSPEGVGRLVLGASTGR